MPRWIVIMPDLSNHETHEARENDGRIGPFVFAHELHGPREKRQARFANAMLVCGVRGRPGRFMNRCGLARLRALRKALADVQPTAILSNGRNSQQRAPMQFSDCAPFVLLCG